jgi:hypothetical protein
MLLIQPSPSPFIHPALTSQGIAAWSFSRGRVRDHAVCVGAALFLFQHAVNDREGRPGG